MVAESSSYKESEAIILVKAAPQAGSQRGETVCCAAIDIYGKWLRLYPVAFRRLEGHQKFGRWDRVKFQWRKPNDDIRIESRRIIHDSLTIMGELKQAERERFLARAIVTSLDRERSEGRSLALLKAEIIDFKIEKKSSDDIADEKAKFDALGAQSDLFAKQLVPYRPAPYRFKYKYLTEDGQREGTCQDWEIEATFFKWSKSHGEREALELMRAKFGEEYPRKGMLLAMGTHSQYLDTWLINGIIRLDDVQQLALL